MLVKGATDFFSIWSLIILSHFQESGNLSFTLYAFPSQFPETADLTALYFTSDDLIRCVHIE